MRVSGFECEFEVGLLDWNEGKRWAYIEVGRALYDVRCVVIEVKKHSEKVSFSQCGVYRRRWAVKVKRRNRQWQEESEKRDTVTCARRCGDSLRPCLVSTVWWPGDSAP